MLWILIGMIASILFGSANAFLKPIADVLSPFYLQWLLGATLFQFIPLFFWQQNLFEITFLYLRKIDQLIYGVSDL